MMSYIISGMILLAILTGLEIDSAKSGVRQP